MSRTMYDLEVPSIVETQLTGVALTISKTIRGVEWRMTCDSGARPLAILRNGKSYPTLATMLRPMHRAAAKFLNVPAIF